MSTELISKDEMAITLSLAKAFHQSGYFSKNIASEAQAFVKIVLGREYGLGPAESLRALNIIHGKPGFDAAWIAGRIKGSGKYDYDVIEHTDELCILRFTENKKPKPDVKFDMEDARKAGLLSSDMYRKYPRNMMFARAMTNGARWYCAEIFNGAVFTPDELRGGDLTVEDTQLPSKEEQARAWGATVKPTRVTDFSSAAPSPATEAEIQADLERLGLRKPADADPLPDSDGPNPWLHVLEGVVHDGVNSLPFAGKRLCEVLTDNLRKLQMSKSWATYVTAEDKQMIDQALNDPSRREEALAVYEQMRSVEAVSFEDDAIPDFGAAR